MSFSFWSELKRPILALAPLADVTDAAFRRVIAKYSKGSGAEPFVFWTEFVSADGLCHPEAQERLLQDLTFTRSERPIVAQLFSARPEKLEEAARLVQSLGFDGLDLNMGCPDRSVEKQGAGAALMKNSRLARELIQAAKRGAPKLPISIKTRIGYNRDELETWLPELLAEQPAVVTIHARTRKEMSKVPARWDDIARAVKIRNEQKSQTLIFGNGDVKSPAEAKILASQSGADGVMLGRAIFGNPWLFAVAGPISTPKRLAVLVEHTKLFEKIFNGVKNFSIMKKHFKAYVEGFPGAKELRVKLMATETAEEVEKIVVDFLSTV